MGQRRGFLILITVVLVMIVAGIVGGMYVGQRQGAVSEQQVVKPIAPSVTPSCVPPESKRCQEAALRATGKAAPVEFDYDQWLRDYDSATNIQTGTSGPSFLETFGWWVAVSLFLAVLVAAFSSLTIQQTAPIAVGIVIAMLVIQNWWLFLIVVFILVLAGVGRAIGKARNVLFWGASLLVIWEIIQRLRRQQRKHH